MTKQEYLRIRNVISLELMHEYYAEHFDHDVHKPFLNANDFAQFIQMWPFAKQAYEKVLKHYDEKFGVTMLSDKDGKLITYL